MVVAVAFPAGFGRSDRSERRLVLVVTLPEGIGILHGTALLDQVVVGLGVRLIVSHWCFVDRWWFVGCGLVDVVGTVCLLLVEKRTQAKTAHQIR